VWALQSSAAAAAAAAAVVLDPFGSLLGCSTHQPAVALTAAAAAAAAVFEGLHLDWGLCMA
jgi:hypothetical protein